VNEQCFPVIDCNIDSEDNSGGEVWFNWRCGSAYDDATQCLRSVSCTGTSHDECANGNCFPVVTCEGYEGHNYLCGESASEAARCIAGSACPGGIDSECDDGESCFKVETCADENDEVDPSDYDWYCGSTYLESAKCADGSSCSGQDNECPDGEYCLPVKYCQADDGDMYCGQTESAAAQCKPTSTCPGGLDSECSDGEQCFHVNTCDDVDALVAYAWYCGSKYSEAAQCILDSSCSGLNAICPNNQYCMPVTKCSIIGRYGNFCGESASDAAQCIAGSACPGGLDSECDDGESCFKVETCADENDEVDPSDYDWYCGSTYLESAKCADGSSCSGQDNECPDGEYCLSVICPGDLPLLKYCGFSFENASLRCGSHSACPGGSDDECDDGLKCFSGIPQCDNISDAPSLMPTPIPRLYSVSSVLLCIEHGTLKPIFRVRKEMNMLMTAGLTDLFQDDEMISLNFWPKDESQFRVETVNTVWLPYGVEKLDCKCTEGDGKSTCSAFNTTTVTSHWTILDSNRARYLLLGFTARAVGGMADTIYWGHIPVYSIVNMNLSRLPSLNMSPTSKETLERVVKYQVNEFTKEYSKLHDAPGLLILFVEVIPEEVTRYLKSPQTINTLALQRYRSLQQNLIMRVIIAGQHLPSNIDFDAIINSFMNGESSRIAEGLRKSGDSYFAEVSINNGVDELVENGAIDVTSPSEHITDTGGNTNGDLTDTGGTTDTKGENPIDGVKFPIINTPTDNDLGLEEIRPPNLDNDSHQGKENDELDEEKEIDELDGQTPDKPNTPDDPSVEILDDTKPPPRDSKKSNGWIIAVTIIVVLIIGIIAVVFICVKKNKKIDQDHAKKNDPSKPPVEYNDLYVNSVDMLSGPSHDMSLYTPEDSTSVITDPTYHGGKFSEDRPGLKTELSTLMEESSSLLSETTDEFPTREVAPNISYDPSSKKVINDSRNQVTNNNECNDSYGEEWNDCEGGTFTRKSVTPHYSLNDGVSLGQSRESHDLESSYVHTDTIDDFPRTHEVAPFISHDLGSKKDIIDSSYPLINETQHANDYTGEWNHYEGGSLAGKSINPYYCAEDDVSALQSSKGVEDLWNMADYEKMKLQEKNELENKSLPVTRQYREHEEINQTNREAASALVYSHDMSGRKYSQVNAILSKPATNNSTPWLTQEVTNDNTLKNLPSYNEYADKGQCYDPDTAEMIGARKVIQESTVPDYNEYANKGQCYDPDTAEMIEARKVIQESTVPDYNEYANKGQCYDPDTAEMIEARTVIKESTVPGYNEYADKGQCYAPDSAEMIGARKVTKESTVPAYNEYADKGQCYAPDSAEMIGAKKLVQESTVPAYNEYEDKGQCYDPDTPESNMKSMQEELNRNNFLLGNVAAGKSSNSIINTIQNGASLSWYGAVYDDSGAQSEVQSQMSEEEQSSYLDADKAVPLEMGTDEQEKYDTTFPTLHSNSSRRHSASQPNMINLHACTLAVEQGTDENLGITTKMPTNHVGLSLDQLDASKEYTVQQQHMTETKEQRSSIISRDLDSTIAHHSLASFHSHG